MKVICTILAECMNPLLSLATTFSQIKNRDGHHTSAYIFVLLEGVDG